MYPNIYIITNKFILDIYLLNCTIKDEFHISEVNESMNALFQFKSNTSIVSFFPQIFFLHL